MASETDPTTQKIYTNILIDDDYYHYRLFQKRGGIAILVNGDEAHLDAMEEVLNNPAQAREIADAHNAKAESKRALQNFYVR